MKLIGRIVFVLIFYLQYYQSFAQNSTSLSGNFILQNIKIVGNNKTKSSIIEHELLFSIGDTIDIANLPKLFELSKTNLLNTSLFNFVEITYEVKNKNCINILITVQDRWSIIPRLKIKTAEENFNAWIKHTDTHHLTISGSISEENFRGYRECLSLSGSFGYNKSIGIRYFKPNIFRNNHFGLGAEFMWIGNTEAVNGYFDYKPNFLKSDSRLLTQYVGTAIFQYRPTSNIEEAISISYNNVSVTDLLIRSNPSYFPEHKMELLRFASILKFDFRDYKSYPLNGFYLDFMAEKQISVNKIENNVDFSILSLNGRYFKKIYKKWHGAIGATVTKNWNDGLSNFLNVRLGQSGLELRSFEYFLIPIDAVTIGKVSLKYQLINKTKKSIGFINNKKFGMIYYAVYASIFADGAFVDFNKNANYEQKLHLTNKWLGSIGIGLDFVTYYDFVIRAEYSHNLVFNKNNFAINFKAAI